MINLCMKLCTSDVASQCQFEASCDQTCSICSVYIKLQKTTLIGHSISNNYQHDLSVYKNISKMFIIIFDRLKFNISTYMLKFSTSHTQTVLG